MIQLLTNNIAPAKSRRKRAPHGNSAKSDLPSVWAPVEGTSAKSDPHPAASQKEKPYDGPTEFSEFFRRCDVPIAAQAGDVLVWRPAAKTHRLALLRKAGETWEVIRFWHDDVDQLWQRIKTAMVVGGHWTSSQASTPTVRSGERADSVDRARARATRRYVALMDVPEDQIRAGDIVVAGPGEPTRLLRHLPLSADRIAGLQAQTLLCAFDGVQ